MLVVASIIGVAAGLLVPLSPDDADMRWPVVFFTWFGAMMVMLVPGTRILRRMQRVDMATWAAAQGFELVEDIAVDAPLPLFRHGTRTGPRHHVRGSHAGIPFVLGPYHHTFRDGTDIESEQYHVVVFTLPPAVAARFAGVYVRPKLMDGRKGRVGRRLAGEVDTAFESHELTRRFDITVDATQDRVALFELFSPTFVEEVAAGYPAILGSDRWSGRRFGWEQHGNVLACFAPGEAPDPKRLAQLLELSCFVARRYLDEWR